MTTGSPIGSRSSHLSTLCRVALLVLLGAGETFALDPAKRLTQYVHDSWTTNEGLPQDSINSIAQTPDGYLWVATQEGVARFNGVRFDVFDSANTGRRVGNFVYVLHVDRGGRLWIGTGGGLVRYEGNDRFRIFDERSGWHGSSPRFISEDSSGALWAGAGTGGSVGGKGIVRFKDGEPIRVLTTATGLPNDQVYGSAFDEKGQLWIGTGNGLTVMNEDRFTTYGVPDGLPSNFVRIVLRDRGGNLWFGTPHGLTRYRSGKFTTFTTRDGLLDDDIIALSEDRNRNLWIGTAKGLNRLTNGSIEAATGINGIENDQIFAIHEDREGSIWIGTHASGLHRLRDSRFVPFGPAEGLRGSSVSGIRQDSSGKIWIGTSPGGANIFDPFTAKFTVPRGAVLKDARTFFEDRSGGMWIGTNDALHRYSGNSVTSFTSADGLPKGSVNVVLEDRAGTLWAGTHNGIARFVNGRFEIIPFPLEGAPSSIRVIHEARTGRLWIGGGDGLGYFEKEAYVPFQPKTFGSMNVFAIHEDPDGTIWATTWGEGLVRIRNNDVARFTTANGLFDDAAWSILDDGLGHFWLGSNRGVFRVSRKELNDVADGKRTKLRSVVYGTPDGMRKRETNAGGPAAIRASDGRLWFGTTAGAVVIDPQRLRPNTLQPPVVIEGFVADGKNVAMQNDVELPAGTRSLEVHYAALSFVTPARIRYRYKLEGFDRDWIDAGSRRDAYYTNIDPGRYTFRVIAANEDGVWNETGASMTFRLRPFYYQTWWFYVAVILALLLLAPLIGLLRARHSRIQHQLYHDPLTGLPNRGLLTDRAEVALTLASRLDHSIAMLFLDLDGFKGVNDQYGHAAGDRLLQLVAMRLKACIREIDTLARIGGDEFAVLVADLADEARAAEVARRMIEVMKPEFVFDDQRVQLGLSIGIAIHPFDGTDVKEMLKAADRAMYRAKLAGGNSYQFNASDVSEKVVL